MTTAETPIAPDELEALFAPFAGDADRPCALAVSGGSDSTALMVLLADWLVQTKRKPANHVVLTVDHGLRTGSAEEARGVGVAAERLGFRHAVLTWVGAKPHTAVQEAARGARYALIAGAMREMRAVSLFTGHTQDDQAETLLMRLARGSGVDGLSAMASRAPLAGFDTGNDGSARDILRPLLAVPKARLRATLASRGIAWMEDPSNERSDFERVRLRAARADLDALGLSNEVLARSAHRLQRARAVLEAFTDTFCAPGATNVTADTLGRIAIDRDALRETGDEIALRVMMRVIRAAGGVQAPVAYARLETIVAACVSGRRAFPSQTLARALVTPAPDTIFVEREPGRDPLPILHLAAGETATWDGRFRVSVPADFAAGPVEVRALTEPVLLALRRAENCAPVAGPRIRAAALVPALWIGDTLAAVPALDYWATVDSRPRTDFIGLSGQGRGWH